GWGRARLIALRNCRPALSTKREKRNKTRARQVLSLATRRVLRRCEREKHAPKSYSIQKCRIASRTPDGNSNGTALTPCDRRIGHRCYSLLASEDSSCPRISMVRVAGKLPRLRLYDTSAVSVDGIGNRWLCPQSAVTFSQRAALSDAKSASRLKARLRPANYMGCGMQEPSECVIPVASMASAACAGSGG